MAQFNNGDSVVQVLPAPVAGVVCGFALDQQTGAVQVKVAYTDAEGEAHERHFLPTDLAAR
jgi:hypothetical protein